jgi:hypothetical protein
MYFPLHFHQVKAEGAFPVRQPKHSTLEEASSASYQRDGKKKIRKLTFIDRLLLLHDQPVHDS